MGKRWQQRPPGSNWGEFGEDDQLGRLNLLTPAKVLQGIAEVKTGERFCLSLPLDLPGGNVINARRLPPVLTPTTRHDGRLSMNYPFKLFDPSFSDVVCDDAVTLYLQYSTQWDSFAHMGSMFDADGDGTAEVVYYNGWRGHEHIIGPARYGEPGDPPVPDAKPGVWKLGIDTFAATPIQGRGVLIDLEAHFGRARRAVGFADIEQVMKADAVVVEPGDMVLFHTGYAQSVLEMAGTPDRKALANHAELDGDDPRLLEWIADSGLAALVCDNYSVEKVRRSAAGFVPMMPIHELCLFKLGIPLGELWHLTPLAQWLRAHRRARFLLTAPPLRLPGAAGSPLSPVATV
ncbi:MAG: cyclase family protein [Gammaproteobacteria bacterium]